MTDKEYLEIMTEITDFGQYIRGRENNTTAFKCEVMRGIADASITVSQAYDRTDKPMTKEDIEALVQALYRLSEGVGKGRAAVCAMTADMLLHMEAYQKKKRQKKASFDIEK